MIKRENMIKVTPKFNELKVDMNYETGAVNSPNNCRIVTKGSELDCMYQQVYEDYMKVQKWNEKNIIKKRKEILSK